MENQENNQKISPILLICNLLFLLLIIGMIFVIQSPENKKKKEDKTVITTAVTNAFNNISLEAKAVYVYDIAHKEIIYKKNESVQLPLASLTKLMMALTATELLPGNTQVTINKEFLSEEGDSGLLANESWKLKDLLDFSLIVSSNDGARSIASVVGATTLNISDYTIGREDFVKKMNDKAGELNLKQTYFINETGLDEGQISGGYGSAQDIARLMEYMLAHKPSILEATKYSVDTLSSKDTLHRAVNTNIGIPQIPGLIASKTGFTDLAGGNLAIAFDASLGHPIVIVVLGSSEKGRFSDVHRLVQASLEYIRE